MNHPAYRTRPLTSPRFFALAAIIVLAISPALLAQKPDVKVRVTSPDGVAAGEKTTVVVEMTLGPKWHVNANKPAEDFLIPTTLSLKASTGKLSAIRYPKHVDRKFAFSGKPLRVYEGTVRFETDLDIPAGAKGTVSLTGSLGYQACNEEQCFMPEQAPVEARLVIR
jgi:DsbC/DsbD-like thiol-disulfide interchange protein